MTSMRISFHGADRTVTGFCHLVERNGRRILIDAADRVQIFAEEKPVRAKIHTIGGFSAHADQVELLAWYNQTGNPDTTCLVHSEEDGMQSFARRLESTRVEMPENGAQFQL